MSLSVINIPPQWFQKQKAMLQVCYGLTPIAAASVYLFGWRALATFGVVFFFGIATEALFTWHQGKPVTSAVLVTCLILALSLPPTLPLWMAGIGIIFAVVFGKMAFGGFGRNVFNPAMVGRCFLYIAFPIQMTSTWSRPLAGPWGGLFSWAPPPDGITSATPLTELKNGITTPFTDLFFGTIPGSLGETSALLILGGGLYLLVVKAAPWRIALSCLLGGVVTSGLLSMADPGVIASPVVTLLSGSFLFGTAFVATEPISGAKTRPGQWIYGFMIGCLIVFLRSFSNFAEGVMFAVLLMNGFVPILDYSVRELQARRKSER